MRILMLNNEFPPLGGGTGVVNDYLLKEISLYPDIWVDLVTSSRSRTNYEACQYSERVTLYKVPVNNQNIHHSSNRELITFGWRALLLSRKLMKEHRYDLSFAFAGVPAGAISYMLSVLSGLPYLVSLQGPDVPGFENRYNYLYPFLRPLIRRIWKKAAVVVAISKGHQSLAHQTMPQLEIPIISNGIDTRVFHPAGQPKREFKINILCVGRLVGRKGQHFLLEALATLRGCYRNPIHLTLVGTGDAESSLRRMASGLGVADTVTFAGFVPRDDIIRFYHQADIFVLPSQNEGMSIALLEAMACGLPVLVTDTGGTSELVEDSENGYVVPWANVAALTNALAILIQDEKTRRQMGEKSRRIAESFSWPDVAQKYLRVCMQIQSQLLSDSGLAKKTSAHG
jgi:phosphatidylinositol alpha-1,6-mannosyltransferase